MNVTDPKLIDLWIAYRVFEGESYDTGSEMMPAETVFSNLIQKIAPNEKLHHRDG